MKICNDTESFRKMLVKELFGVSNLQEAEFKRLSLPVHKGNKLSRSKIVSLGKKYFTIPVQFRSYFPDVSELKVDDDEVANEPEVLKPKKRKRKQKIAPGSQAPRKKGKGPGRPKKLQAPIPASQSLYRFFVKREKKSDNN